MPRLAPPDAPPVPLRLMFPVPVVCTTALLERKIPELPLTPATPVPTIEILPPAALIFAPLMLTPMGFADVPVAELINGLLPPPRTISPPLELMTEPEVRAIAPAPFAS